LEKPVVKHSRTQVDFFSMEILSRDERFRLWYAPEFFLDVVKRLTGLIFASWALWLAVGMMLAHMINRKLLFGPLDALVSGSSALSNIPRSIEAAVRAVFDARSQLALHSMHSSVLLQAAKSISSHVDLNHAMSRILDIVVEKFPDTACSVTLLDEDGFIRVKNTRGLSADFIKKIKLRRGEGFAGECVESKKTMVVQDVENEKNLAEESLLSAENIKSFIHVPIIIENRAVGTFNINSFKKNYFTHDTLSVAATLCEYLSVAISNAKIYDRLRDFNRRLESEVSYTTSELLKTNAKLVRKIRAMKSAIEIFGYFDFQSPVADAIIAKVLMKVRDVAGADFAALVVSDAASGRFKPLFRVVGLADYETAFAKTEYALSDIPSLVEAMASMQPVVQNAPMSKSKWKIIPEGVFIKTSAVFPIFADGQPVGAVLLANKIGEGFDDEDQEFMRIVSFRLGAYIHCVYHCQKKNIKRVDGKRETGDGEQPL
ncbi:MAG: GAF domain-containing protein, partial [Endomicrobiia bacterium]|nr:GAF domain-containing protein [Endomicrobiia bacterium]